jgi:hypothetical protein
MVCAPGAGGQACDLRDEGYLTTYAAIERMGGLRTRARRPDHRDGDQTETALTSDDGSSGRWSSQTAESPRA